MGWIFVAFGVVLLAALLGAWRGRVRLERRADLLDLLAAGCRRGVPLPPLLAMAAAAQKARRRRPLEALSRALQDGTSLADALAGLPRGFLPAHAVGAVRAAEGTDRVAPLMEAVALDAADALNWRQRVFLTAVYPLLVLVGALGVHGAILRASDAEGGGWLVPRVPLGPWSALLFLGAVVGLGLFLTAVRRAGLVPGARSLATARLLRAGALLSDAGLPLTTSLARAAGASGSPRVAREVHRAVARVEAGAAPDVLWEPLALRASDRLRLATAGSRLPGVLRDVAANAATRWRGRMETWFTWLQPAAIVAVSVLVFLEARHLFGWLESARDSIGGLW